MRWRRTWAAIAVTASAMVAAGACSDDASEEGAPWSDEDPPAVADGSADSSTRDLPLEAPRGDADDATLVVVGGTDTVQVATGDLGDELYRISVPDGAGVVPRAVTTDATPLGGEAPADGADGAEGGAGGPVVEVHVDDSGTGGPAVLQVELAADVRWTVRLSGGATEARVDGSAGGLAHLDVPAGVQRLETWLPSGDDPVTVTESGGASQVVAHAPEAAPVRIDVRGGAGSVDVDGDVRTGVSAGTVVAPPGWDATAGRIDLVLVGGVSSVVVDRTD